ncbi:MAG TPA: YhcH/YjgK/YiaL family protein [Longimicrobiaceae bacterium]|nr:YhcH/YjgK/YiaL family protein [Longimicrobiaceae bacterium]
MILDSLDSLDARDAFAPGIQDAVDYLRGLDPSIADGRHPIRGDDLFALVQTYETGPSTEKRFESHRRYLDVQFLIEGSERILHVPVQLLTPATGYDEDTDLLFYQEPRYSSSLLLRPGDFAVFHPGDAHKPGCMAGGRHRVRKVVVKVRI